MDIGLLEQHVLLAVQGLHPNAYGVAIQDRINALAGYEPSIGSVYAAIERLENKRFLKSRQGEPTRERGGRAKLYLTLTAHGQKTLLESLKAIDSLRGLKPAGALI
jgi:DNA-binding PadR family transcriptional regulator